MVANMPANLDPYVRNVVRKVLGSVEKKANNLKLIPTKITPL
jgi:hypothetical protein